MTISTERLLPCPFCGSDFLMGQEPYDNHPVAGQFYLYHRYGAIGSAARSCPIEVREHFDTADEAIAAWNRRSGVEGREAVALERVNIPDPCTPHARIVGFRIREGDAAWGDLGLSEPLAWLDRLVRVTTLKDNTHEA